MTVEEQLQHDIEVLDSVEAGAAPAFRTWRTDRPAVVVGCSVEIDAEVDVELCRRHDIAIVRRASGGRSVLVGPGTLQYAFVLPYSLAPELRSISASKRYCNGLLLRHLAGAGRATAADDLGEDESGDLVAMRRKVAGLALKRRRHAMLLHGTLLERADIALIEAALKHPLREPAYRRGRAHGSFLGNLGSVDERLLEQAVRAELAKRAAAWTVHERSSRDAQKPVGSGQAQ